MITTAQNDSPVYASLGCQSQLLIRWGVAIHSFQTVDSRLPRACVTRESVPNSNGIRENEKLLQGTSLMAPEKVV